MTDLYGCLGSERVARLHRSLPAMIFFLWRRDVNACLTGVLWELNKGMGFNKYSRWDIPIQFLAYSRYSISIKNHTLSCMETYLRGHTEWLIALLFKKKSVCGPHFYFLSYTFLSLSFLMHLRKHSVCINGCVWRLKLKVKIRYRVMKNVIFWYPHLCVIAKFVLTTLESVAVPLTASDRNGLAKSRSKNGIW